MSFFSILKLSEVFKKNQIDTQDNEVNLISSYFLFPSPNFWYSLPSLFLYLRLWQAKYACTGICLIVYRDEWGGGGGGGQ